MHWRIPIEGFSYASFRYSADNEQALVDTGSSYIGVPASVMSEIARITGAKFNSKLDVYVVPCSRMWTLPNLVFQLNNIQYTIPSAQYIIDMDLGDKCALTFYSMKYDKFLGISWILGAPFIRTFCTIFDYGERRIGFAVAIPR
ncbi:hypothetical protein OESDEN_13666 [Oesophagostomum dentatum]|uniref:Peptidase A1 domain-containing protein n=1 Tax=Oesophagostomum dentatum TaxID=61180 RepID=A0A0B1SMM6_OESDE|nr:hypothetical protein OESDEN_13666 [Oesophagostomum dentatum]